jgi:3-deoxy-D-manno-octulosonic-acid transferase
MHPLDLWRMIFFYQLFRLGYQAALKLAALWNPKAKKWVAGRTNWQKKIKEAWIPPSGSDIIWMHCASLGEFEQGRPVLERWREKNPATLLVVTFFSPSGFEVRKNYMGADAVFYLPFDSPKSAKEFLTIIQPKLAIFVKYEFWFYYLQELKHQEIPTILIAGIFRETQPFFQKWGQFHRSMLNCFTHLFVQNQHSADLLAGIGLKERTTVAGDPRFDRVLDTAANWKPVEQIEPFIYCPRILVAGSTWKEDEELLAGWLSHVNQTEPGKWQLILAPHETKETNIVRVEKLFPGATRFSDLSNVPVQSQVLIVNNVGFLSRIYKYGTVTYVGGGFNKSGHHNILEAAVFGKPVLTGPRFEKFKESIELKELKGSFCVHSTDEMMELMQSINIEETGATAARYVEAQRGATQLICTWIQEKRRFTNA